MSSIMINRTVFSDNGTLQDISVEMNDFIGQNFTMPFVSAEDYLYVASDFPFNHRWIEVSTANDQAASIEISVWEGDTWVSAEDIIDQTSVGGVSLSQSGHVSFRPDEDEGWSREDTNDDSDQITGLTSLKIFDMYWARIKWSADLNASTAIKYIGHKFSNDDDLRLVYPVLMNSEVLGQFETGKTTWDPQHFRAAEMIIRDLKRRNFALSRNQILNWDIFTEPSIHKVAETAYRAFGKDFEDERRDAAKQYSKAMDQAIIHIDRNRNAILDSNERTRRTGFMSR